jgi:threonine/homoserine/homoserine lactone efflux protein
MDPSTTLFDHVPLAVYILALTLTPGPSSLLIAASGARFGLARCMPHLAGALIVFELQLLVASLGKDMAVLRDPLLQTLLQLACTAYLLWLGWRLLDARPGSAAPARLAAPLGWRAAAALQLANPKPWLTAVASAGLFLPATAPLASKGAFVLCAGGAGGVGLAAWAVAGMALQRWLGGAASRQAALNRALALALLAAALWGLADAYATLPLPLPELA